MSHQNDKSKNKKTAGNNQWTNTHLDKPRSPQRHDGPGGE